MILDSSAIVAVLCREHGYRKFAAVEAFIRYGKGRHPAALNYGDCMTYATAHLADHPLLFTGEDFARTDLTTALA